jgi:CHAD domain-containing protein
MDERVGPAGRRAVVAAHRAFIARARRAIGANRNAELHRTRIAAKRLRYTIEFFESVLGPARTTALGLLALMQDRLGSIADAEAFSRFYADLAERLAHDDPRRPGVAALRAACDANRQESIDAVGALWRGGPYPPYPDMLAASISSALGPTSSNGG